MEKQWEYRRDFSAGYGENRSFRNSTSAEDMLKPSLRLLLADEQTQVRMEHVLHYVPSWPTRDTSGVVKPSEIKHTVEAPPNGSIRKLAILASRQDVVTAGVFDSKLLTEWCLQGGARVEGSHS
jgi:hypothetical protein